jgi:peptidoglycan/LPS O-acetylase OafA/YrhL
MLLQTLAEQVRIGVRPFLVACVLLALNSTRWLDLERQALTVFGVNLVAVTLALWVGSSRLLGSRWLPWRHLQRHDYSYAIYIYHWPVMLMLKGVLPPVGIWAMLAATLAIVLPLSVFSWHCVTPSAAYVRAKLAGRRAARQQRRLRLRQRSD